MKDFFRAMVLLGAISLACNGKSHESESDTNSNTDTNSPTETDSTETIDLPPPFWVGEMSLEECLGARRSVREFTDKVLTLEEISQLLWAAQGITHGSNRKTSPSAGALYPMEVYLVTADRFYHYLPDGHRAEVLSEENLLGPLSDASNSSFVSGAPAMFVLTAVYERTEEKYGERAERYVKLEAGHVAQNILLQAIALGLGATPVGAFEDAEVQKALSLPDDHAPLYLVPVGNPAQ